MGLSWWSSWRKGEGPGWIANDFPCFATLPVCLFCLLAGGSTGMDGWSEANKIN